ncbi:MAG: MogA/MoaB family molybdenum cofactor biosynthesis protein [Gemmatimonadaceae bacterium]|nr:MogA/MoaB family molybdenum cofactor biosynthesis protein [Gemmatimonadaceae bacterium]
MTHDDKSPSTEAHRAAAAQLESVRCMVFTISDSRTLATDESGALIERLLIEAGHLVVDRQLLTNDVAPMQAALQVALQRADVDVVLCTGGTGLGSRDQTVEVVRPLLERELPGFGELFRGLSFLEQIGAAAMLSRALAGAVRGKFVAVMPGSRAAVELAMTRLLIPEIKHVLREIRR